MTAALAPCGRQLNTQFGPRGDLGWAEVLQPQVEPAVERRVDHGHVRPPLLPAGNCRNLGLRVAQQNLD